MRYLFLLLFLFPSCTAYEALSKTAVKAEEAVTAATEAVAAVKAKVEEIKAAADKDGDGKVSFDETLAYLIGLLGLGGGGALMVRNAKSDARKQKLEADVAELKSKA